MKQLDLLSMRQEFNDKNILLCFNGPISSSLIQELGNALRNYLQVDEATPSHSTDVFGVYIELTQNIRHYTEAKQFSELESSATVVVGRYDEQHYSVLAGNMVDRIDGLAMKARVHELAAMDKAELKAAYKKQLREPRDQDAVSGAGLGLIDIARRSAQPITCDLTDTPDGKAFFSILAIV